MCSVSPSHTTLKILDLEIRKFQNVAKKFSFQISLDIIMPSNLNKCDNSKQGPIKAIFIETLHNKIKFKVYHIHKHDCIITKCCNR